MTLTQLATQALRDLGCLRTGQSPSPDALQDCRTAANQMIDSWLLDDLMLFTVRFDAYTLTAGVQSYTIGPSGATFTAARPLNIEQANIILNTVTPVVRVPLDVINDQQWASIAVQALPNAIPLKLYYDRGFDSAGKGTLYIWPGPLTSYQLELYTPEQLTEFADLVTDYSFPPGYAKALRKNLAVEIAPMMDIGAKSYRLERPRPPLLALVQQQAAEAKAAIQSYNAPDPILRGDPALSGEGGRAWSYGTGLYRK